MRTKINYQKADGKWYELICYDYSIEQDFEKLTSDNKQSAKNYTCPKCGAMLSVIESRSGECYSCCSSISA